MSEAAAIRILLVEDDEVVAQMLGSFLEKHGFHVEYEARGDRAVQRILGTKPDAVVLDGMLPGKDGFDICREIRNHYRGAILILTSRCDAIDHVLGLELGADDYMPKPAEPRVVLARIRACLRRGTSGPALSREPDEIVIGYFRINRAARTVHLGAEEISFTTAEFDLLWLRAGCAGTVLTRDDIKARMRGIEHDGIDRSIDMRISRLRKRLGDNAEIPTRIKTVRTKGYLFSPTAWN